MVPNFASRFALAIVSLAISHFVSGRSFQVVAYNVENLFDTDGVSLYDDYKPEFYGPKELQNKLNSIVRSLRLIGGSTGPEVVLLQEIEVDRTPREFPSATELLLNALKKNGLGPYQVAQGYDPKDSPGNWPSVQCVTLSKFPISSTRLHPIRMARPILETTLSVGGVPFTLFNNHWKSGASSKEMESHRLQNAKTLRNRIDEITKRNPFADFLVGGDLNSHYNQSTVYAKDMPKTGINDVLLSHNLEPAGRTIAPKLYNLWHELPHDQRGSDAWRGNWGTLMHLILPQGLYDAKGIRYLTDSFEVSKLKGVNSVSGSELPYKWSNELDGFGASDHFPVLARFETGGPATQGGNSYPEIEQSARKVDYTNAIKSAPNWQPKSLDPANYGVTFRFNGKVSRSNPDHSRRWTSTRTLQLQPCGPPKTFFRADSRIRLRTLVSYRGQWQFIVEDLNWINDSRSRALALANRRPPPSVRPGSNSNSPFLCITLPADPPFLPIWEAIELRECKTFPNHSVTSHS